MPVSYSGTAITWPDSSTTTSGWTGFKNRIINGAMVISQYNGTSSVTPTSSAYVIDRWRLIISASSKLSVQQNAGSVTPPAGYPNYLGLTSLAATSVGSTDEYVLYQKIEGFNTADLAWGTASASAVTLSFKVYSSLTGTFGGAINNSDQSRSYPFTYTISSANTWTTISVTIPGDTTGTWVGATNGVGMVVRFGLGVGSTYSGTAGAWSSSAYDSATGATSVVGTNGATFYITGVQLERGSTASSFEYRPYGTELALCQRYGLALNDPIGAFIDTTNTYQGPFCFPVEMRAAPTLASGATYTVSGGSAGTPAIRNTASQPTTTKSVIFYNSASNWAAGNNAKVTGFLSAEL